MEHLSGPLRLGAEIEGVDRKMRLTQGKERPEAKPRRAGGQTGDGTLPNHTTQSRGILSSGPLPGHDAPWKPIGRPE